MVHNSVSPPCASHVKHTYCSRFAWPVSVEVESTLAMFNPPLALGVCTLMPAAMCVVSLTWSSVVS